MEIVLPITSRKRAHLNAHLTELEADLIRVRSELRKADKRHRYRRAALLGNKRRRQLVVLTLVRQFMPHMALPLSIAKLILPSVVWKDCRDDGVTVQAAHLERMLDRQLIKDTVQKIKNAPGEASHVKILTKSKRLATEYKMFSHVLSQNSQGVTAKLDDMLKFLDANWPVTGDASDAMPGRVAAKRSLARKWFWKFRRLWKVSFSRLPTKGVMSDEVRALKVCSTGPKSGPKSVPKSGPKMGPRSGPKMGPRFGPLPINFSYKSDQIWSPNGSQIWSPFWAQIWGPKSAPELGPEFQVKDFLKWAQWLWAQPLAGHEVVVVNIDESPVYKQVQPTKGYVIHALAKKLDKCRAVVTGKERRGMSTLMGCVVSVPELQKDMPQFILTNDAHVTNAEKSILARLPPPIQWVKGTRGWVTSQNIKPMLTAIRKVIRSKMPSAEIVICMDCAAVHTTDSTLVHLSKLGLHSLLIPGGLTGLLQPLDNFVFGPFKKELAEMQERKRGMDVGGDGRATAWIGILCDAIRTVIVDRSWASTFERNGMASSWENLRPRLRDIVQPHLPIPCCPPTPEELWRILGVHRVDFHNKVLKASLRASAKAALGRRVLVRTGVPLPPVRLVARAGGGSVRAHPLIPVLAPLPPMPPPAEPREPVRVLRSGFFY